jgi:hypothetical protein
MLQAWGWRGALLVYIANSVLGIWYFSLALMNHNGAPTSPSHLALVPPSPTLTCTQPHTTSTPRPTATATPTATPTPTATLALTRRAHA